MSTPGAPPTPIVGGASAVSGDPGPITSSTVLTNITPNAPPPMKTLVYSPEVRILIAHNATQYDVSSDVVAFSIRRVENSVSSFVFRLANKMEGSKPRYTNVFDAMDRVTIFLKRVEWHQIITGYLDSVPLIQLYPGTVDFRGSCTLKRLVYTYWDPGLPDSAEIFDQMGQLNTTQEPPAAENLPDAGLGSLLRRALVNVGGWNPLQIHISQFPLSYFLFLQLMLKKYPNTEQAGDAFRRLILGDDISAGTGAAAGRQLGVTRGAYVLTQPERMMEVIRAVDEMGMGPNNSDMGAAQGIGTAATGGSDPRDQPAWKPLQEVGKNWSEASMKNDAAVHCFMTITIESGWRMLANPGVPESLTFPNDGVGTDSDSIGLYQQRQQGWGSVAQRMNPRESSMMFLQHLNQLNWRNMDRGEACANVQNPRSDLRYKYSTVEQMCVEQVRALRQGTGSTPGGQVNPGLDTGLGAQPLTTAPAPVAGIPGLGQGGASLTVPTQNGIPTPTSVAGVTPGTPQYNTAGALTCARAQIGKPYVWGGTGPSGFDCSGLMWYSYRSIGVDIGRDTTAERSSLQRIPMSSLVPGDLIQPNDGHVVMFTGAGTVVEAPQPGENVRERPIGPAEASGTAYHVPGTQYGGSPFATFNPNVTGPGAVPGTVAPGDYGGTAQIGSNEPIARNLFTWQFAPVGKFINYVSMLYGNPESGSPPEAAFMNDEPLLHTIVSFAKASMRNFQSAPNGDFIAYYPDYWGIQGRGAVLHLEDIEMKNVQINKNDDAVATHVYVAGSALPLGGSMGEYGWLTTRGIATVENSALYQMSMALTPSPPGTIVPSGQDFMRKFGARPLSQEMPNIVNGPMEMLMAIAIFMEKWAQQYATQVSFTFMPELYPGMRISLSGHNLQVYVTEVVHSGDYENGFTTEATIMAPSNPVLANLASAVMGPADSQKRSVLDLLGNAALWMAG